MIGSSGILESELKVETDAASEVLDLASRSNIARSSTSSVSAPPVGPSIQDGHYRVLAFEAVASGAVLLQLSGLVVDQPNQLSVQVGEDLHVSPPPALARNDEPERYLWRFLNHSCEPNAYWSGRHLIALRDIRAWEEITFDYNCTEWEIAVPFVCACGRCAGDRIRGFRHLSAEAQREREPYLRAYLQLSLNAARPA